MAINTLNIENIKKWTAALRSGKYKQGREKLAEADKTEFCCLGVACEVAIENGIPLETSVACDTLNGCMMYYDDESQYLPYRVYDYLGIDQFGSSPIVISVLMGMNDSGGYNFEQIADYIEKKAGIKESDAIVIDDGKIV